MGERDPALGGDLDELVWGNDSAVGEECRLDAQFL